MALFVFRPDPDGVSFQSRQFITAEVDRLNINIESAQARFDAAELAQLGTEADYNIDREYAAAKAILDQANAALKGTFAKHEWEMRHDWKRKIPVHPKQMPTPWIDDPKTWADIFRKYNQQSLNQ